MPFPKDGKKTKPKNMLVQVRTYQNPQHLPLKNNKVIQIKAGQEVWFYKFGPQIFLMTEGELHHPEVEPEDIWDIFNEYTEEQIISSDFIKLPVPKFFKKQDPFDFVNHDEDFDESFDGDYEDEGMEPGENGEATFETKGKLSLENTYV